MIKKGFIVASLLRAPEPTNRYMGARGRTWLGQTDFIVYQRAPPVAAQSPIQDATDCDWRRVVPGDALRGAATAA